MAFRAILIIALVVIIWCFITSYNAHLSYCAYTFVPVQFSILCYKILQFYQELFAASIYDCTWHNPGHSGFWKLPVKQMNLPKQLSLFLDWIDLLTTKNLLNAKILINLQSLLFSFVHNFLLTCLHIKNIHLAFFSGVCINIWEELSLIYDSCNSSGSLVYQFLWPSC